MTREQERSRPVTIHDHVKPSTRRDPIIHEEKSSNKNPARTQRHNSDTQMDTPHTHHTHTTHTERDTDTRTHLPVKMLQLRCNGQPVVGITHTEKTRDAREEEDGIITTLVEKVHDALNVLDALRAMGPQRRVGTQRGPVVMRGGETQEDALDEQIGSDCQSISGGSDRS